jgi:hypothetical protein
VEERLTRRRSEVALVVEVLDMVLSSELRVVRSGELVDDIFVSDLV